MEISFEVYKFFMVEFRQCRRTCIYKRTCHQGVLVNREMAYGMVVGHLAEEKNLLCHVYLLYTYSLLLHT